jgi:geranylgeranyl pyrophosphate synthase
VPLLSHTLYYTTPHKLLFEAWRSGRVGQNQLVELLDRFAEGLKRMTEGQMMDLTLKADQRPPVETALQIANLKTGSRLGMMAECAGIWLGLPPQCCSGLAQYGIALGTALQLANDLADIALKPVSPDLLNGRPTLPLVFAAEHPKLREELRALRLSGDTGMQDRLRSMVLASGGIQRTALLLLEQAGHARSALVEALGGQTPESCLRGLDAVQMFGRQMFQTTH